MTAGKRIRTLALVCAISAALFALPPASVPWLWTLGYALPGAVLLAAQRLLPRWMLAGLTAAALSLFTVAGCLRMYVPAGEAAPMACILVAPLAYFALRQSASDRRYALFLALCLLVIGSVLDHERARRLAVVFAASASVVLWHDAGASARGLVRSARGLAPLRLRLRQAVQLAAVTALTALSLFLLLSITPVPERSLAPTPAADVRPPVATQGLSAQFDLSPADGWLDTVRDLQAPVLAAVRSADGPTPPDLYLRFTHFDLAGANRWATGKSMTYVQPEPAAWTLFAPQAGRAGPTYTIERAPLDDGHLMLPAGTWRVEGVAGLVGHAESGLLRQHHPGDDTLTYRALTLAYDPATLRVEVHAAHLLSLPEAMLMTTGDIARLAERYAREGSSDPWGRARAIARALRRDYAYSRRDPVGPAPDVLHNFLFHARAGYCMHFASALAMMLRLQRIPCRIGAGLYGGRPDPERPGFRLYGDADAHAWVEVPCVGVGFVVLDATPESSRTAASRDAATDVPEPADAAPPGTSVAAVLPPWLLPGLFLLGLIALPWFRGAPTLAAPEAKSPLAAAHPARVALERMLANLAALGLARSRSETLHALALRAHAQCDGDIATLRDAFAAYEELRFGGAAADGERRARLLAGVSASARLQPREAPAGSQ
jgi:transglutaminase-like putative cysteine protease